MADLPLSRRDVALLGAALAEFYESALEALASIPLGSPVRAEAAGIVRELRQLLLRLPGCPGFDSAGRLAPGLVTPALPMRPRGGRKAH